MDKEFLNIKTNTMKEKIRKIWKDPVWSKIISATILGLGAILFLPIKEWLLQINIYEILSQEFAIPIWSILSLIVLFAIFVYLINRFKNKVSIKWNREYLSFKKSIPGKYFELIIKCKREPNGWENYGRRIPEDVIDYYCEVEEIIESSAWGGYSFTPKGHYFFNKYISVKFPKRKA